MGEFFRDGEARPVTSDELEMDLRARDLQALQRVPVLQHTERAHEYLFVALFDGTGQDADNPAQRATNIGVLKAQLYEARMDPEQRIGGHYVEGIGTQERWLPRVIDQYRPFTWDDRIREAYVALAEQTRKWQRQDPDAQIRVASAGYSRGCVLSVGLARLVDEYGIADPENMTFGHDPNGNLTVDSDRPPLVPPGRTAQALALLDPVATNMPEGFDARVPPSVVSAMAIAAAHERRTSFPHQTIIEPGLSADRRFANLLMPGGHSNIGGGNAETGLEAMAHNRMVDYLNGLRDRPVFEYRDLPGDRAHYTVYQARGVTAVPGLDGDGMRDLRSGLANCKVVDPCRDAEPMDPMLADGFVFRRLSPLSAGPVFSEPLRSVSQDRPASTLQGDRAPRDVPSTHPPPRPSTPDSPDHPQHGLLRQIRGHTREREREGAIRFDSDLEREQFCRYALAACLDNRNEPRAPHPGRSVGGSDNGITRADHIVIGTKQHAFVIQGDARDPAARRIAFAMDDARQTPVEQSDRALAIASNEVAQHAARDRQRALAHADDEPARVASVY